MSARVVVKEPGEWSNKHQTVAQGIDRLYDVWNPDVAGVGEQVEGLSETVDALQSLISDAMTDGVRLRAIGSGWSISDVAATDGRLVNTKPLNWLFRISDSSVDERYAGEPDDLVLAQCGANVSELNKYLEERGRSLKTQGASNGQTIAGAFSTGTHGSALDSGAMQDHVVGIHLIVGPLRHVWLERASYPVVSEQFTRKLRTELIRDDTLFNAALVSFGSFGIIHAAMIETEPVFLLETHRARTPFDDAFRKAVGSLDFTELALPDSGVRPHHFDAVVNPYDIDEGVYYTVMYKRTYSDNYERRDGGDWGRRPGDDFLHVVGLVSDEIPDLIPGLVNKVVNDRYGTFSDRWGTLGEIFSYTAIHGRGSTGSALAVPLERAIEAIDLLLSVTDRHGPFGGVYGIRFARATRALLGFTRFETTCILDLDGVESERTRAFFQRAWRAFDDAGLPYTCHWGKAGPFNTEWVRRAYGSSVEEWLASRHDMLDEDARRVFTSPFLERTGLDRMPMDRLPA